MSGIRILLKGGQHIDSRGTSMEIFKREFTNPKENTFSIADDEGINLVLRWSEVIGAIDLDAIDPDSNRFDKWLRKNL
jgi:hypothetical protein